MDTQNTQKSDVALREEEVLAFWREHNVFNKSVEAPAGSAPVGDFVFYDGPPFATGTPHYGHILAGTLKDAIPRFWTMNGYRVKRTWGWDCHGLPLENLIEKRLGLATKRDIEALGVKQFNEAAREAVLEYADDWKEIVPRLGRFVDMDDDYRTMDASYTESVWWVFGELHKKGLVYEGFKSMHLCPRCGTTLSNFEVNQGYKDIKDIAVTVKMPLLDESGTVTDTSILIWTTTPWTLPGNMAVAINKEVEYVKFRDEAADSVCIASKQYFETRLREGGNGAPQAVVHLENIKGADLIGKSYQPPFDTFTKQEFAGKENAWKIYHADYVSTEDGTGAVHIAPAYGDDDMQVAKEHNVPILHHVDTDGRFKDFVTNFAGQLVKPKDDDASDVSHLDADIEVVKRLKDAERLFKKENITHSYPHCWRCDTPLLNYATTSWFVRVTDLKDKLVAENAQVKWVPEHVGINRFGKWLEGARDWAVSRQRYWGASLPVWKNPQKGTYTVLGSLDDLKARVPKSGNQYFLMRHGEAESNVAGVPSTDIDESNPLTEKGATQVLEAVPKLQEKKIDLIIASPYERVRMTTALVARELGISEDAIIYDDRLGEIQVGSFNGKPIPEYHAFLDSGKEWSTQKPEGGESWQEVMKRAGEFLYELERTHTDKNILIVAHNSPLRMLGAVSAGAVLNSEAFDHDDKGKRFENAEIRELAFTPLPHNENYELDFHRPYIDEVTLVDEDGTTLVRVPDVFDCWFESGAMPYGQKHFMGTALPDFDPETGKGYPAEFIAEGLDQTRGWFYSLMVLGVALFGKSPYAQVVVNGLILAEDGKKMSKSLQNYPDPVELVNRVGADAMRMYLLTSPAVRGEDLSFSEKDVLELQRKNIGRLHNVLTMYEMFEDAHVPAAADSSHVLDRWIRARLYATIRDVTAGYRSYEMDKATRPLEGLIDDISVWYLRRSRDRLKSEDVADKTQTLATLRFVLRDLALLLAPAMPFYAEYLFLRVREEHDAESVHLSAWPKGDAVDPVVLGEMSIVRELVSVALEARTKANIKVRQPLASLTLNIEMEEEYAAVIRDEINVKRILSDVTQDERAMLDTALTAELKQEGDVREFMRAIQDLRKKMGLHPQDRVHLAVSAEMHARMQGFEKEMMAVCGIATIVQSTDVSEQVAIDGTVYAFGVVRV